MTGRPIFLVTAALVLAVALAAGAGGTWAQGEGRRDPDIVPAQEAELYDPTLVREYRLTFEDANWEAALTAAGDLGNAPARLQVGEELLQRVGVRYKGLSSLFVRSRKRPLNVTTDAFVPRTRLLGYDAINLNNGYSDPSFVRESLMTEMLRPFMPTQQTAYAKVQVHGEYLGQYLAVEQVEGTYVAKWFPDSDGILIKGDPPAGPPRGAQTFHSALAWEGEDLEAYRTLYEVKTAGAEEAGLTVIREAARVLSAPVPAGGTADADLPARVPRVLDVDRALWFLAANNLFVNYDSYYFGHNYFLYQSEEDGLLHLLLWDTSLSFGGLELGPWAGEGSGPRVDPFAFQRSAERPVVRRLLSVPEWRADYVAHYRVLLDNAFDPEKLLARGAALQALARPGLETDPNRLFALEIFERNLHEEVRPGVNMGPGGVSPGIVRFARDRGTWLRTLPALAAPQHGLVDHARAPDAPRPKEPALVTLRFAGNDAPAAVRLVYRVDRGRPEAVELRQVGDAWRGVIPGNAPAAAVTYYVRVGFADGRSAFHPAANLAQPWRYAVLGADLPTAAPGDLVLNEMMAINDSTVADEAGEFDDWLELHNRGAAPVSLSGLYLSDDAANPWAFPLPDVVLAPGEHLVVWCDNDPEQGPLHATFALSGAGESAVLSSDEAILDQLDFGPQEPDVSLARVPDGGERWVSCSAPTPGERNLCPEAPAPTATDVPTAVATGTPGSGATPTAVATAPPSPRRILFLPALHR